MDMAESKREHNPTSYSQSDFAMDTEKTSPDSIAWNAKILSAGPIVFVIGPPASGKGMLCSRLCQQIPGSFTHLSIGDYLRGLCSSGGLKDLPGIVGSLPREQIPKYVQESRLLPPDTIIPLLKDKLASLYNVGWLIDGFPRDIETAQAFEKEVSISHCLTTQIYERHGTEIYCVSPGQGSHLRHCPPLQPSLCKRKIS